MNALRPHFGKPIAELEALVETQRENHSALKMVRAELAHRDTERAVRLRAKITAILAGLELPLPPVSSAGSTNQQSPNHAAAAQATPPKRPDKPAEPSKIRIDRQPMSDTPSADPVSPLVSDRILGLIDYVIAIEKAKLKLVTDLAQHGGFHRTYDELAGLPGIAFNRVLGDGDTALLTAERLTPRLPPAVVDPVLRPWVVIADDPARAAKLRERLSAAECAAAGIVLPSG